MTTRANIATGLVELPTWTDKSVRQAVFRQSLAQLALATVEGGPGPLDGIHPEHLLRAVVTARQDGLLDDLSFLVPEASAVALYELAGALPLGNERRDLGRRVLAQLFEGSARTFVAVASRMAATSSRALTSAGAKARIALSVFLPRWAEVRSDALSLALASRRDLSRQWIGSPSTGSLPERRLAARLLERAARELSRRARQGDPSGLRLMRNVSRAAAQRRHIDLFADPIAGAWHRLLTDRESLVWRHVAIARGLLAPVVPEIGAEVRDLLDPTLSATEWRRAATSLAASIAVNPEEATQRVLDLASGPLIARDPGIATALVWGLGAAAESEPEAAEEALNAIATVAPISIAESLVELRADVLPPGSTEGFGAAAAAMCTSALGASLSTDESDEGLAALGSAILADLKDETDGSLRGAIARAALDFVESGARTAHASATAALDLAQDTLGALLALDVESAPTSQRRGKLAQRTSVRLLREIDTNLFESHTLKWLLLLDRRPSDDGSDVRAIEEMHDQLAAWLLKAEAKNTGASPHQTLHSRQLRALLHLIDSEANDTTEDYERVQRVRAGWTRTSSVLLTRLASERGSPLRRAVGATIARAFDALARDGAADPADILLYASMRAPDGSDLDVLGEASVEPDVAELFRVYARFVRTANAAVQSEKASRDPSRRGEAAPDLLAALENLTAELPVGASPRIEVLRGTLEQLHRGLEAVRSAGALAQIAARSATVESPLALIDKSLERLGQLVAGARRRCGDETVRDVPSVHLPSLESTVLGMLGPPSSRGEPASARAFHARLVGPTMFAWLGTLSGVVPPAISDLVATALTRIGALPTEQTEPAAIMLHQAPLPLWVPPRRILGGFYIQRQLGGGALGTVFVVTRADERNSPTAERFALKVPDYDATAARSVSETDFLRMFRLEAGALLSVPEHKNVARFVTFDAGARPKPILVMELVEGARADQVIDAKTLDMPRALAMLDGVLAGLEAMHSVGVGHLDVKPSNVILRPTGEPVLVDFGLAGRHIRPGCGTGCYCAPEVWGVLPRGGTPTAMTADVYAFGCFAYEVLTSNTLFGGMTDAALISAHLTHDGVPPPVRRFADNRRLVPLAEFLTSCLRQNPSQRASVTDLRRALAMRTQELLRLPWPVPS
ncbi:MAG: serine/threonine protein kinase [Polyangiaceae bacterium]|nr:serine/threonine protein kinase [Polyangiaceae bacterium]